MNNNQLMLVLYVILYLTFSIFTGKIFDKVFPKYDKNKNKMVIYTEVIIQVYLLILFSYYTRKYINTMILKLFEYNLSETLLYSEVIFIPLMFTQMKQLFLKIDYITDV